MRATDKDVPQGVSELTEDDRRSLMDIAKGVTRIWDGLTMGDD